MSIIGYGRVRRPMVEQKPVDEAAKLRSLVRQARARAAELGGECRALDVEKASKDELQAELGRLQAWHLERVTPATRGRVSSLLTRLEGLGLEPTRIELGAADLPTLRAAEVRLMGKVERETRRRRRAATKEGRQ